MNADVSVHEEGATRNDDGLIRGGKTADIRMWTYPRVKKGRCERRRDDPREEQAARRAARSPKEKRTDHG